MFLSSQRILPALVACTATVLLAATGAAQSQGPTEPASGNSQAATQAAARSLYARKEAGSTRSILLPRNLASERELPLGQPTPTDRLSGSPDQQAQSHLPQQQQQQPVQQSGVSSGVPQQSSGGIRYGSAKSPLPAAAGKQPSARTALRSRVTTGSAFADHMQLGSSAIAPTGTAQVAEAAPPEETGNTGNAVPAVTAQDDPAVADRGTRQSGTALRAEAPPQSGKAQPEQAESPQVSVQSSDNRLQLELPEIELASFQEVTPGVTTLQELQSRWGAAESTATHEQQRLLTYKMQPFARVEVQVIDGIVESVALHLAEPAGGEELARSLGLDTVRKVEVPDEFGHTLGCSYPELGVLFGYDPESPQPTVAQILLERIDAQAFVLRAEQHLHGPYRANLADLHYAVSQFDDYDRAHWLTARILLEIGRTDEALQAVNRALELAPRNNQYRLTKARCLADQGQFGKASEQVKSVIASENLAPLTKAQASVLLGFFTLEGPQQDYQRATDLFLQAIKLADPLATAEEVAVRRPAKLVLLNAHLGVARSIGWGNWNRKDQVVPRWVDRAEEFARDLIDNEAASPALRLHVIEEALRAHVGFRPAVDPISFLDAAQEIAVALDDSSDDPLRRERTRWQLGLIYSHATKLAQLGGDADAGRNYGKQTARYLEKGIQHRSGSNRTRFELGESYFRIGAVSAVLAGDHEDATQWYGRAAPLLMPQKLPGQHEAGDEAIFFSGQVGEALVSMGVSYWQTGLHQKAIETTGSGVKLIENAVDHGILARGSLAIPYSNLASMHQQMGDRALARTYTELASRSENSESR